MSRTTLISGVLPLLLTACLKDGVLPPPELPEGPVDLRFELVRGLEPFALHTPYTDGQGNVVYFTELKFLLSGVHGYDQYDRLVADFPDRILLLDGQYPVSLHAMGTMTPGSMHQLHFTAGVSAAYVAGTGPFIEGAQPPTGGARLHLLMRGHVDVDGNGQYDEGTDVTFTYAPASEAALRDRHMHLRADMHDGERITLGLFLDIRLLLTGIDLLAHPEAHGSEPQAVQVMNNLTAAIMVRY